MNTKIKISTVFVCLLYGSLSLAQTDMSLEQSVERAVLSNPEISASFQDFQSRLEGKNVARGALFPEINTSGWVGREWRDRSSNGSSLNWTRRGYTLELRQLLFDGFATLNQVSQLSLEQLAGYYELLSTVDSVALEATLAHLDVQRYRDMVDLANENYNLHLSILKQIEQRKESGVGRGVDLEQAYGRQALAQSNLMIETGNLNDVLQRYQRIVGLSAADYLVPAPSIAADLPVNPSNFNDALRINPTFLAKQALVQAAEYGKDVARGRMSPTLELRAATGRDKNNQFNDPNLRDGQSSNVQLVANFNLYRGGADAARIRQTAAQEYAARDLRDYTCRNMQQELNIAWGNMQRLYEQIPFLEKHELSTSQVRVAYMQQFQIGQRSLLDLLDTENELFDARRALFNARYDLKQAEFRWLAYSHKLLPALGLAQPYADQADADRALDVSDDIIDLCSKPAPTGENLKPVAVSYSDNLKPPVLSLNTH